MKGNRAYWLAWAATLLGFVLSWHLTDPVPFVTAAGLSLGGKYGENMMERHNPNPEE